MKSGKPKTLLAIDPDALMVSDADAILDRATGALAQQRAYLGPLHLGLMTLLYDAGHLPTPDTLASRRDISALQHSLAELETVGLTPPAGKDHRTLTPAARQSLAAALENHWEDQRQRATAQLAALAPARGRRKTSQSTFWTWLRHMMAFISHRGLRVTQIGALNRSDLRRFEDIADLPARQHLEDCLAIGRGMDLFFQHGDNLLIGAGVDLLDLPGLELSVEILHRWASGDILLGLPSVSGLGGLLGAWLEPLTNNRDAAPSAQRRMPDRLFRHDEHSHQLIQSALAQFSPEPVSAFLTQQAASVDLQAARAEFLVVHQRLRTGLMTLMACLPRERPIEWALLGDLVHAHVALDMLRRPALALNYNGQPQGVLFASATQILPTMRGRLQEHLKPWFETLMVPAGVATCTKDTCRITNAAPLPPVGPFDSLPPDDLYRIESDQPIPQRPTSGMVLGQGRLIIQPNGEVIAPPDASIHAIIHMACGGTPSRIDTMMTFKLDRRSLMRLSDAGQDVNTWAQMLEQFSAGAMPPLTRQLINDVADKHGEMSLAPAGGVLVAKDPLRLKELLSHPKLAKQVVLHPAPNVIVLGPQCDLEQFLSEMGDRGFSGLFVERLPSV